MSLEIEGYFRFHIEFLLKILYSLSLPFRTPPERARRVWKRCARLARRSDHMERRGHVERRSTASLACWKHPVQEAGGSACPPPAEGERPPNGPTWSTPFQEIS